MQIHWDEGRRMSGGNSRLFCSPCGTAAGKKRRRAASEGVASVNGRICLRAVHRAAALLLASAALGATATRAQDATWKTAPPDNRFNNSANWSTGQIPTDEASFAASSRRQISIDQATTIKELNF